MTRKKHTSLLKLTAIFIAVLMAHSGICSESAALRYDVSSFNTISSKNIFTYRNINRNSILQLNCPENITAICDIDKCSAEISNGLDVEVVNGNPVSLYWKMEGATEALSSQTGINQIGNYVFNEGVTFVTYTAIDNLGDIVTCSFSVVVIDKQAPVISVPENITIGCNERVPSPYTTLQAFYNAGGKATDNCSLNPVTFKLESEQKSNPTCPYTLTRTYQVADRQGNIVQAKQYILVEKRDEPILSEQEKSQLNLKSGMANTITSTAIGGNWNNGTSWVGGVAPLPGDDVIIANGATISLTGNQVCNDITINGTLNCGGNTLQVNGSWTNNGAFNAGTGTVEFAGTTNASLSGSSSTTFKNFRLNKGAVGNILQINKDIQLGGIITFTSGLMQINSGVTASCTFNAGFTIENNAGIFINGGNFTTGTFSVSSNGLFRIDSGTATIGSNSGNSIVVTSNGTFDINGGNINIAGRLEVSGGTADISGGTINLNAVGQNSSSTGSLDLSLSSDFTMSAGTINFLTPNGSGNFDVIMLNGSGGSKTFTGGVFNFGDGTTDTYKISSAVPFPAITSTANTNLEFKLLLTSAGTYNFPLVNNSGSVIPATVQFTGGAFSPGAFVEVKTTASKYTENKSSVNFLKRFWTVSTSGISNPVYNFTASYSNGDISGTEAKIAMGAWSGSKPWIKYSVANGGTNTVTANSVSGTSLLFAGITSDPPTVDITNGASVTICSGSSVNLASVVSGDPVITYSWSPATGLSGTNIGNPVASPVVTTTYTLTVTDGNGFTATDNITVNVNPIPAVDAIGNQIVCNGTLTDLVTFSGTGTSYSWTNNNTAIGLAANGTGNISAFTATNAMSSPILGTITVTPVYSSGGVDCTGPTQSFTITVNPTPVVNDLADQTVCNGTSTSSVIFSGTGTSYTWTNSNTAIGLAANGTGNIPSFTAANNTTNPIVSTITVTPVYSNGGVDCAGTTQSFTITVNPAPTVNDPVDQTVCNGTLTALVNFTGTATSYTWTNSNTAIGLAANGTGNIPAFTATNSTANQITGTITVTPVYSNGGANCNGSAQSFTINVTPSISANAVITDVIKCFGGTANILISASGGTSPYTFNFQGKSSNQTGVFTGVTGSVAGTSYNWSVTDALNCAAASGTITVTQPAELTASAAASAITCNGLTSTVIITANGGTPPISYTFNGVTKADGNFTGITSGTYSWSVKDANNCGPVTDNITITQPTPITITSANVTTPIACSGGTGTVTIIATGGTGTLSYTFNGQTNTTGVFTGVYAGTNLSYSVKDANGCGPVFGAITVTQPTAITASAAITTPITCNGGTATVTITASGGAGSLSYTFNGITQASNVFTGVTPGNNIPWSVKDANNCGPVSGTINVTQPAALTASVLETSPVSCFGGTANIQITAAGGTGTKTYAFQGQPSNQTGIFNGISGSVTPGTSYNWSVTDANGCSVSGTYNVVQPSQIVISSIGSNSAICQGATLNLTSAATGGTGTLRYSWTGPNGYTANNAQNPGIINATPAASGTYTLTVTDANNCTATATTNVTVNATPTMTNPGNQTVCHNSSTAAINFTGATSYTWTNNKTSIGLAASGAGNIPAFTALNTGSAPVTATITVVPTGNGCPGTPQSFTITVNPIPNVIANPEYSVYCNESQIRITLGGTVSGTTYSWVRTILSGSIANGTPGSGTATSEITQNLNAGGGGAFIRYIVTPTANGCTGEPDTAYVEFTNFDINRVFSITGTADNTTVCPGQSVSYTLNSQNGNYYYTRFWWASDNPNIGLTPTGGPLNNDKSNNDPVSETVSFIATNDTDIPQTANIVFSASAHDDGWASTFLCDVAAITRTITVAPFAITCPTDITANTDANQCYATITRPAPALTCGTGANITWTAPGATPASGNNGLTNVRFPKGVTTVTYRAQKSPTNYRECSFTVTVTDNQPPVFSNCPPATTTLPMDPGQCGASFTFNPTATDNCDNPVTLVRTDGSGLSSGDIFPAGTTIISYLATDVTGNTSTCSFSVTVQPDNQPPVITCFANQAECAPAGSGYTMLGTAWDATVTENCPGIVSKTYTLSGATSGTGNSLNNVEFNVGTTNVTWTAKDANNITSSCNFDVVITQSPEVTTSPLSQSVCLNGSVTLTAVATGTPAPTFQWRKNGVNIPGETSASLTLNSIVAGDAGTYDVEVTNGCGAAISAPAVLTVTSLPVITQQPASQSDCRGETVLFITTAVGGSGNYTYYWESKRPADANFVDATHNNNWVTFPNNGEMLVPNLGNARSPDQTQYRVTVTDDCGNSVTSDIATISVNQITNIDLVLADICQGFGTSFTVTTSGSTPIIYQWRKRNALGNWVNVNDGGAYSGATTATLTISNATPAESGEYSARAQFNITVPNNNSATTCWENDYTLVGTLTVDEGPAIVATPASQTVCPGQAITEIVLTNANGTTGTTYEWTRDNTTILTGMPVSGTGETINGTLTSLDPTNLQTTVFTITATANGCISTSQVTITVGDDEAPTTASCPSDIPVNAQAGICGAVVNYTAPTFDDNCDGNGLTGTLVSGFASGETFPVGTTTVTYEYTDAAGNTPATCSFDVTVSDNIDPTAVCKNITVQLDATGNVTITPADIDNNSTDNCGTPALSLDITSFDCSNLGNNTVVLTAADGVGNTATCSATVTVKDDDNPVAISANVSQQDTLCLDDVTTVNIAATGGVGTLEYKLGPTTNTTGIFSVPAGYSYAWSVTNSLGCGTTSGNFFVEVRPDAGIPVFTAGSNLLCQDAANETYTATATNSNSISYSVLPAAAGSINSASGEMDWNAAFSGTATIRATATGFCNTTTEDFIVDITPTVGTPTAITVSAGTEPSCQLTNGTTTTTYATTAVNSTGFNWSISNPAAGSIDPTSGVMTWADGFTGTVDIQVTANGCNGPSAQITRTVDITPSVGTPTEPDPSDATICQGSSPTTYTTLASGATSYNWTVTGAGNTISGSGITGTVTWNPTFSGIATISVTAEGCNGPSAAASTTVTVLPTPDASISGNNSVCQNTTYPDVVFNNPQSLPVTVTYKIGVGASQTIDIAANSTISVQVPTEVVGDFDYNLVSVKYQGTPDCVTNISGSVTVTIRPEAPVAPVAISGSNYVLPATSETYSIAAVANAASYEWFVPAGWSITSGQGTTSVTVTTGIAGESGDIRVIAKNDCGDSPETKLFVDINPNLTIVAQPVSQSDCYNNTVLFSVSISGGAAPIVYTWQRKKPADAGFTDIVGDADITYPSAGSMLVANIGSTSNPDGTQYRVRITDDGGSDQTSNSVTLTVNEVLTMSPVDVITEICEGENAAFSATTGGETPISMRWEKDGVPVTDDAVISGSATTNISFTNARPSDAGEYRLTVTFPMSQPNNNPGNPNNCVITSVIYRTLVVNPLPVLNGPAEVCTGQTINWTPNTGGTWTSSDPSIATIDNNGLVTGISQGTVTFTFNETATGCSSTSAPLTVRPLPTGEIAGLTGICESESASFTVTLTGTSPWNFTYTDGTTPVSVTGITSSPYTVNVTPAASTTYTLSAVSDAYCDATSLTGSAVITVNPLPTADLSGNTTICVGTTANLSVTLTGSQPWSIEYTDGVTPVTVTGITSSPYLLAVTPGTTTSYSLTAVSDVNCTGTSFTGTATVTVDQLPTATAGGTANICVNGTATVSGATAEFGNILWTHNGAGSISDAATLTPTYTAAAADAGNTVTLTLTVTSNNTCSSATPATATFTVNVDPLPVAAAGGSQTACTNETVTVSGASAENGTILWTHNGSGTLTGETTLTPAYTAGSMDAGTSVTLTMTVTSDNACSPQTATAFYTVNVLPEAQVNQPADQELCKGTSTDMISFSTSNTTGTTTYSWTNSEPSIGLAASGSGNIIAPFTASNTGTEPLVATIAVTPHLTSGGITCDGPAKTFTITVNPEPHATAPIGLTYCNGILSDPFTLTGTPTGVLFDISGGASIGLANVNGVSEIPAFTPTSAGTATLTIIPKFNGCTGLPVSFNVTVRPTPVVTMSGGGTVCQNSAPPSIIFSNPMNLAVVVTYSINGTNSTVNIPDRSNASITVPTNIAGNFTYDLKSVQYLDLNPPTCPNNSITGTATFEVIALPVPGITGPTNICAETTGNVYSTEAGMSNYTWVVSAAGSVTAGGTPTDNTVTVTWNTGGSHNISVRYNNSNGCAASVPTVFPVNVYTLPIPTITGSTSACLNSSKVYSTQPGMTNYQWNVSGGGTVTSGGGTGDNTVTVTWNTIGAQTVSVNYTSADGCDAPAETVKNITVNPLPNPTITGPNTVCAGTSGNVYSTEPGMSTYVWTVSAGGTITSGGSSNSATATIRWNTDGPQTVSVSYLNPTTGCTPPAATVYNVNVDPMPVPTIAGPNSVCVGSTGNVYTTEAGMSNYVWTIAAGGTISAGGNTGDASVTVTWTTAGSKTVKVNYRNANGCSATTATTHNVTVNALPNPVIAGLNQACLGSTITYSTLAGMSNYIWTVPAEGTVISGGSTGDNQVKVNWNTTGNHTISLNYTNPSGCSAVTPSNYAVTVFELPTPTISGPADACKGGAATVYTTEPGMTGYIWSISGGNITAGGSANDNTATVVWNTVGTQTISVNYYNANSCPAASPFVYPVNVLAPAPPTCPANSTVCSDDAAFVLSGGAPAGGVYSGPGVTLSGGNYIFNPATAGPGVHTIAYTMPNICSDQCTFTITVDETPVGSASAPIICSGYPTDILLNSTVAGTTFSWTASVISGSVTGYTNCVGSCGNMITDTLINNLIVNPGASGANAVVRYIVTASKNGCSNTFNIDVTVRPQIKTYNLTWNSNFVEDFIEVCAGAEALSDNDIEVLDPSNGNLVGPSQIPASWSPVFLYGPSPAGPWTSAPGNYRGGSYYEWIVDFSINNRLGYHYFIMQITDPVTGCIKYSNPAILNVVSALIVEAGDPEFICGGSDVLLTGAYVGGLSSAAITGKWTVTGKNPAFGSDGTLSNTNFTLNPAGVVYTPPAGYIGTVTLTLTTNDPSGTCVAITDTRNISVVPPTSFTGCTELAGWPLTGSNSNGIKDDGEEPCLVTLVGSDNLSGSAGNTDINHCTGAGNVSFDWTFLAPPNKIVWHQEDQTVGASTSSTNLRVNRPTNVSAGDLIIITVHINDNNLTFTPGNGFTQIIRTTHNSYTATVASFYKIATGAEPAAYNIVVGGGTVGSNDRIYASRVTGHSVSNPIGGSNGVTATFPYTNGENGYRTISIPGFATAANSMLVAALAVDINNLNVLEFSNAPLGMTTVYYDDNETSSRVATAIISGNTGTRRFQWPSYNSRNRETMYAAAQMFTINPATNEKDEAYFLVNGTPTLLGNTNGASGSRTVSVASGDEFGFRVGTITNTGGPGRLIIYNLTMPNDTPVLTGSDSIFVTDCQTDAFTPTFEDPTVTDDCGTPVLKTGYPITDPVVSDDCSRTQKRTWIYVDDCGTESLPFEQTAVWSVLAPITLSCPVDPELEACTDPAVVTTKYNEWVAGFTATGGCSLTTNLYAVPPLILANIACGDTLTFKFIVNDDCGQKDSCTSTFTVKPIITLNIYCPADTIIAGCQDTAAIRVAYNTWKAKFSFDGGCAAVTDNMVDFPPLTDLSCGGRLDFIYSVYNSCGQFASCASSFTVEPLAELSITVPAGVSLPLCSSTTDIEAAYNLWKTGFSYSGGCNVTTNIDLIPDLGDITCGGTISFVFTAANGNSNCEDIQQDSSTFTVAEAPELIVSCPVDPNIEGCLGIQAITDAYDTWVDGFRASGGCNITTNIASIPPLGDLVCNGQLTFTFIVGNDESLCTDHVECTSTFTIGAAPDLEVIVPADTVIQGCNTSQGVIDAFNAWKTRFTYTGGCNVSASDLSVYDLPSSCGGTVTVIYTVWDNCSQAVTDSAKFTLNPEFISVNAPLDEIQSACQTQTAIDDAFAIWKAKFGFTGGCGTIGTDLSVINAPNACGGTIVVNYSAQDVCGQVVNTSAIFTIDAPSDVLQEPSFTVPADITIYRDGACAYDADPAITGVPTDLADNCTLAGNLTMAHNDSIAAGSCSSEIIIYRRWIVADNCLNETSKTQIITVQDNTPPVVVCAPDVDGVADNGECDATNVVLGTSTATDNCALASFVGVRSDGLLITDPFPVGVTTITWTATDACGNSANCVQTVTLTDGVTQPPTITCPGDVVQNAGPNNCYLENVAIDNPVADDNCEVATISWVMTGATTGSSPLTGFNYVSGETFYVGVTEVEYTATDSAGNSATCKFYVTIKDVTPPVINLGSCVDVTDNAAPNNCSKVPEPLNDPDYSDTCWPKADLILSWEMTGATTGTGFGTVTDSAFNVGVTYVVYIVADPDGNKDTCDFTVTIKDVTAPEIDLSTCKNVAENATPDNCSKIPDAIMDPTYSDNCWDVDSLDLTYIIRGATTGAGSGTVTGITFNVGVSNVTYIVTDPDGNLDSCNFTVTIIDVTPPVIDMTKCVDVTDVAAPNNCSKVPADLEDPEYSDICWPDADLTLSWTMTGATEGSGFGTVTDSAFNVGLTYVRYIVADPDGNKDTCEFTVIIKDVTPPNIDIAGCQNVTDVTANGNCTVVPGTINNPVYSDDCWDVADLTITWEMTGATIRTGNGSVVGESFNAGITTVKYIVSDPDGNKDSCSFTVTIIPFNPPEFDSGCPSDVSSSADPGVCEADLVIPDPTVTDLCNIGYTVINDFNNTDNASGIYPVGETLVRWIITPSVGTPDTCYQTVTVTDDEDPVITTCPEAQTFEGCDTTFVLTPAFSSTTATSSYNEFNIINLGVATDNCVIDSVTYIDVAAGTCPITITRTWTVFDAAGNSATCDQTITIDDTEAPVVDCPTAGFETPSDFDLPYATYSIPAFDYDDNCTDKADIQITWTLSGATTGSGTGLIPTPYQFNSGITTVSYVFTDLCGNPTPCEFTVFALYPPEITCLPPVTLNTDAGVCYNHIEAADIDNPGVPTNGTGEVLDWTWTVYAPDGTTVLGTGTSTGVSPTPVGPVDFPLGTSTIHWYAANASGHDECDQLVTVVDNLPPTFTADDFEDCVERLSQAIYTGNVDDIQYNPDYPEGDYKLMNPGDTYLDIDLGTYVDNCCVLSDGYSMFWTIDFDGNDPSEPDITGTGQPSTYKDPVSGNPLEIYLWGDGVNFQPRTHTITYTITDCNGNVSNDVTATITINPRPELIKVTN